VGEKIVIREDVVITVTKIQGQRISLGIEAPKSVSILRGELPADYYQHQQTAAPVGAKAESSWVV
jgi:carbon storage regulator